MAQTSYRSWWQNCNSDKGLCVAGPSWLCLCPPPGGAPQGGGDVEHPLFTECSMDRGAWWATVHGVAKGSASMPLSKPLYHWWDRCHYSLNRWGSRGSPRSVSGPRSPRTEPKSGIRAPGFWSWMPCFLTEALCLSSLTSPCLSLLICKMGMTSVFPLPGQRSVGRIQ